MVSREVGGVVDGLFLHSEFSRKVWDQSMMGRWIAERTTIRELYSDFSRPSSTATLFVANVGATQLSSYLCSRVGCRCCGPRSYIPELIKTIPSYRHKIRLHISGKYHWASMLAGSDCHVGSWYRFTGSHYYTNFDALGANSTNSGDKKAGLNELEVEQTIPEYARQGMNIQTGR